MKGNADSFAQQRVHLWFNFYIKMCILYCPISMAIVASYYTQDKILIKSYQ